jgi:hypothetical protein
MSDAYERERQNNSRLSELSAKVTALRGVTVDIYDNARAQDVIDNTVCLRATCRRKGLGRLEAVFMLTGL